MATVRSGPAGASHPVVLLGGRGSVDLAHQLTNVGVTVTVVANTSWDTGLRRPDLDAMLAAGLSAVPVTDEPNPTTVVVAGSGEQTAELWVSRGRPGRLLAVRLAGQARAHPLAIDVISRAIATVLGPDDADLVIDPILKVLAQSNVHLPRPILAVGHGHHRFRGTADEMIEIVEDSAVQAEAILSWLDTLDSVSCPVGSPKGSRVTEAAVDGKVVDVSPVCPGAGSHPGDQKRGPHSP